MVAVDAGSVRWVNEAEVAFWRSSQGVRVDWSDRILEFDCGGQLRVPEIAFSMLAGSAADI